MVVRNDDQLSPQTLRLSLENFILGVAKFGSEHAAELARFSLIPDLREVMEYMETKMTVEEPGKAFATFKEAIVAKDDRALTELTKRWTLADYYAVGQCALAYYEVIV